ncbi:HAD family hydrolase [Winogradskya humida]|uniref:HAD family hydrolase n=1 Tax=Winogradskya humida TaxID=113566 RepID=UPI0023B24BF6
MQARLNRPTTFSPSCGRAWGSRALRPGGGCGAGVRKPDRRIFELGAEAAGRSLADGGWMIGDHPEYDIAGGAAAGLRTVWLRRGRPWPESLPIRPTRTADDCATAILDLL